MKRFYVCAVLVILGAMLTFAGKSSAMFGADESRGTRHFDKTVRVSGGGAALNWVFNPFLDQFEDETKIGLVVTPCGPGKGLVEVLEGKADAATGAVPLETMIQFARQEGVEVDASSLRVCQLGKNRTQVIVHESNHIAALSKEQLKGIFTGAITDWREVGGAEGAIIVVWGSKTPGQNALFSEKILDGAAVTDKALVATDYADIIAKLAANPLAVGIDPVGFVRGAVRTPEAPSVMSPIIAVTKGEPTPEVKKLFDFILEVSGDLP